MRPEESEEDGINICRSFAPVDSHNLCTTPQELRCVTATLQPISLQERAQCQQNKVETIEKHGVGSDGCDEETNEFGWP